MGEDIGTVTDDRGRFRIPNAPAGATVVRAEGLGYRAGEERVTVVSAGDDSNWSLGDAADDAGSVLEAIGGALLVALAVLVPLAALGVAIWFGWVRLRRHRRDRILDE